MLRLKLSTFLLFVSVCAFTACGGCDESGDSNNADGGQQDTSVSDTIDDTDTASMDTGTDTVADAEEDTVTDAEEDTVSDAEDDTVSDAEDDAVSDSGDDTDEDTGPTCTETIDSDIDSAQTWSTCLYEVTSPINVRASLTIEPGVTVEFAQGAGLKTADSGSINAVGTASSPIRFTGTSQTDGLWEAIIFNTDRVENALRHAVVEYGGRGGDFTFSGETEAAVIVTDGNSAAIADSRIAHSETFGVYVREGGSLEEFSNNTLEQNGGAPLRLPTENIGSLGDGNTFSSGNANAWIHVDGGDITTDTTWTGEDVPFRVFGNQFVNMGSSGSTLTIEEGVTLEFEPGMAFVVANGGLSADGTQQSPVVFRGSDPTEGSWEGVVIRTATSNNLINHAEILHAGAGSDFSVNGNTATAILVTDQALLQLRNTTISKSLRWGLYAEEGSQLPNFSENVFADNRGAPLSIAPGAIASLDEGSDYDGDSGAGANDENFIDVRDGTVDAPGTWKSLDTPYRFLEKVYIDLPQGSDVLSLDPGVDIKFADGAGLKVSNGALSAVGDPADLITFEGTVETAGYWEAIVFDTNNPSNVLDNVVVAHGGKGDDFSFSGSTEALIIVTSNSQATIRDSFLSDSAGLCIAGDGNITTSGLTTTGCI